MDRSSRSVFPSRISGGISRFAWTLAAQSKFKLAKTDAGSGGDVGQSCTSGDILVNSAWESVVIRGGESWRD